VRRPSDAAATTPPAINGVGGSRTGDDVVDDDFAIAFGSRWEWFARDDDATAEEDEEEVDA